MGDISSAATSPLAINCDLHNVDSRPSSRILSASKAVTSSGKVSATLDDSVSITAVSPHADPVTFDIKAHSLEAKASLQEAIDAQKNSRTQQQQAGKTFEEAPFFSWMFNVIPIYDFTQRTKLYNASIKAQIKFTQDSSLVRLQQTHVAYLDALSKSELSPKEKHNAYKKFKETLAAACEKRKSADDAKSLSVGCSTNIQKFYIKQDEELEKASSQAEQNVQKLLKDIEQPHAELRNNIAQNLSNRKEQLHHLDVSSDEALRLQANISAIESFQAAGGLGSLKPNEEAHLNSLFNIANSKRAEFSKLNLPLQEISTTSGKYVKIKTATENANAADKVVMAEIIRLRERHALKNNLTSNMAFRDQQLKALTEDDQTREKRRDLLMSKQLISQFLNSDRLSSLTPEEVNHFNDLFKIANEKHADLKNLQNDIDNAPTDSASTITADYLAQANAAFQKADDAIIAKISELVFSAPQPSITTSSTAASLPVAPPVLAESKTPAKSEITIGSIQSREAIDDDIADAKSPTTSASSRAPLNTSSSAASAAVNSVATSSLPAKEDLDALRAFVRKNQEAFQTAIESLKQGSSNKTQLEKDFATLQKFLTLDAAALSSNKISSLVQIMRDIENQEEELATAKINTPTAVPSIEEAQAKLNDTFLQELHKVVPSP